RNRAKAVASEAVRATSNSEGINTPNKGKAAVTPVTMSINLTKIIIILFAADLGKFNLVTVLRAIHETIRSTTINTTTTAKNHQKEGVNRISKGSVGILPNNNKKHTSLIKELQPYPLIKELVI
ncbi:MAG: hypothetical protein ACTSWF_07855, partial [Candidatus Freyarchaeota archaeon]